MVDTSSGRRQQLAREKNKGDRERERKVELMLNKQSVGEVPHPRESGVSDMSLFDPEPAGVFDPTGRKYVGQSVGRGLGNAVGSPFDFLNMLPNAAMQAGYNIFTGHPENAPQFSSVGDYVRNKAADVTGTDIVPDEAVSPATQMVGAGTELATGVAADPLNFLGAFGGARSLVKPAAEAVSERYPKMGANDQMPPPNAPEASLGEAAARQPPRGGKYMPPEEEAFDPWAIRKPEKGDLAEILQGTQNKGGLQKPVTEGPKPADTYTEEDVLPYPDHPKSGIFDYSAEFPERDLGIQRFEPKKVPERTTELLGRQDVKDMMAEGITRGRNFKDWYNTAPIRKFFQDEFGHNRGLEMFDRWMDANSATSPRSDVGTNVRNASYWYGKTFREPGANEALTLEDLPEKPPNPYGHLAQLLHRGNVAKLLLPGGEGYNFKTNPKPIAYGGALKGDLSRVPVDTHAFRAPNILGQDPRFLPTSFKPEKGAPTRNIRQEVMSGERDIGDVPPSQWESVPKPTEYDAYEKYWTELGRDFGMKPGEVQPAGWTGLGKITGLESDPSKKYMDFTEERILKTAKKLGMDPIEVFRLAIRGKLPLLEVGAPLAGATLAAGAMRKDEEQ